MAKTGSLTINSENIFPIIKKWLYSDHDIFYRELVSNGCDAITKLKKLEIMGEWQKPEDVEFKITVTVDSNEKTITFADNGLGMTMDEVDEYINQIAFSGAQDFLEKYKDKANEDQIIGHFGPGFYLSLIHILKSKKNRNYRKILDFIEQEDDRLESRERELASRLGELDRSYKEQVRAIEELRSGNQAVRKYENDRKTLEKLEEERDSLKEQKRELAKAYGRIPVRRERLEGKKSELRVLEEQKKGLASWQAACRQLTERQETYLKLDGEAKEKKRIYEYQDDCFKKAAAGIIARDLTAISYTHLPADTESAKRYIGGRGGFPCRRKGG